MTIHKTHKDIKNKTKYTSHANAVPCVVETGDPTQTHSNFNLTQWIF